jgi:roadblock/LC7 domain-containing protein
MADATQHLDRAVADEIKQAAFGQMATNQGATRHLSLAPTIFPEGHVFQAVTDKITVPRAAALVFIDHEPLANWGHPCTYAFYDPASGQHIASHDALFPPDLAGGIGLEAFHAPLAKVLTAKPIVAQAVDWTTILGNQFAAAAQQERYAILFTSQISNRRHVEDVEFHWRALVNVYGFNPANVLVLCFNGTIGATDSTDFVHWAGNGTPYQMHVHAAATDANLAAAMQTIAGKITSNDLLFIHTNNHGAPTGLCVNNSSVITPTRFGQMMDVLPQMGSLVVTMEQCFSGAFQATVLAKSKAAKTVFSSAVPADKVSAGAAHFDPWALEWAKSVVGATEAGAALPSNPDTGHDGLVSMREAFDYSKANDHASYDDPQYADKPKGSGSKVFLGLRVAGKAQALANFNSRLYAAWKGVVGDDRLFYASHAGNAWSAVKVVPGVASSVGPALAVFGGKLYAAWKGAGNDQRIWYSSFNGTNWAPQQILPGVFTSHGPSLAVLGNRLYAAWKGMDTDQRIWFSSFDGSQWKAQATIPGVATAVGPALATYANKLYASWRGMSNDQALWWSTFNGTKWAPQQRIPGVASSVGPQLAVSGNRLYAAWKGMSQDQGIYWSTFNGTTWAPQHKIGGVASSLGPALGIGQGSHVFALWKGMSNDQRLWYSSLNGAQWAPQAILPGGNTGPDPIAI